MISSYYIINRQKINVDALFEGSSASIYWYTFGINWRAPVAWACGVAPSMPGFISAVNTSVHVPVGCTRIYYINFLTGFSIAAVVFVALHRFFPARRVEDFIRNAPEKRTVMREFRESWDEQVETLGVENVRPPKDDEAVMESAHWIAV